MQIDASDIHAEVRRETDKGILIMKVGFPKMRMWWNGWTVRQSPNYPDKGLWIQPPSIKFGSRYIRMLEFSNDSELFGLVKDEIARAVDRWNGDKVDLLVDAVELEGDELNKALEIFPESEPP